MKNLFLILITLIALSCQTLTEPTVVNSAGELEFARLEVWEDRLFDLVYVNPSEDGLRALVRDLEEEADKPQFNRDFRGRLMGMLGEAYFRAGALDAANQILEEVSTTAPLEERNFLISGLLTQGEERLSIWEQGTQEANNTGFLHLNLALEKMDLGIYGESAGHFDQAFFLLGERVEAIFRSQRDVAFNLRNSNTSVGDAGQYITMEELSLEGVVAIVTRQEAWVPPSLSQGSSLSETVQVWVSDGLLMDTRNPIATRAQISYLCYELLARITPEIRGYYTNIYSPGPDNFGEEIFSPVPDVPFESEFFDAALILVERELMNLPDGLNFYPDLGISGTDFLEIWDAFILVYRQELEP